MTRARGGSVPPTSRALRLLAAAAFVAGGAALRPAAAQMAGVPTPPRVRRPEPAVATSPDSATRADRTSAGTAEQERTRLDIQAWVDSAAGALARSAPAPIPPPGSEGRPSIFDPATVPDSLRPATPAPAPAPRARRPRRP